MTPAAEVDIPNPNAVKVVTDLSGRALYFSRATIPFDRDGARPRYFKHLGLYAYRKAALDRFVKLPESSLEKSERLEQLRFLENGIPIFVRRDSARQRGGRYGRRPAARDQDPARNADRAAFKLAESGPAFDPTPSRRPAALRSRDANGKTIPPTSKEFAPRDSVPPVCSSKR